MHRSGLPLIRLPEPWKTTYKIEIAAEESKRGWKILRLNLSTNQLPNHSLPSEPLHNESLFFSELTNPNDHSSFAEGDNTAWARFHQTPVSYISWESLQEPTVGQMWNLVHAAVTLNPTEETFRFALAGHRDNQLAKAMLATGLATPRPKPCRSEHTITSAVPKEITISRAAFWQGAGSPFGPRAAWVAHPQLHNSLPLTTFPAFPYEHTVTFSLEGRPVHAQHPVRPPKPARGVVIYSRYMPHLDEFFSMVHLDYHDPTHLDLFHKWQNDPRVSQGWNETGTLEHHREYLRKIDEDPHQMAVLAKFNDTYFAYFEIYWAKEDHMGVYLSPAAGDYDRGRHSLVGDARFRGPHRAAAWWTSLIHYIFLDDPRTMCVVGEPKATNASVLAYDAANGFHVHKIADLPHKRSAIVRCERLRFFQNASFGSLGTGLHASAEKGRRSSTKSEMGSVGGIAKL